MQLTKTLVLCREVIISCPCELFFCYGSGQNRASGDTPVSCSRISTLVSLPLRWCARIFTPLPFFPMRKPRNFEMLLNHFADNLMRSLTIYKNFNKKRGCAELILSVQPLYFILPPESWTTEAAKAAAKRESAKTTECKWFSADG